MKSLFGLGKKKEKAPEDFTIVHTPSQANNLHTSRQTASPQQSSLSLNAPAEQLKPGTSLYANGNGSGQMTAAVMVDNLISDIMTELNRKPALAADELRADMSLAMRLSAQMEGSNFDPSTQQPTYAHLATPEAPPMPRASRSANAAIPSNIANKVPPLSLTRSSSRAHPPPINIPERAENSHLAPSIQPRPRSTSTTMSANTVTNTSVTSNKSLEPPLPTLRRSKSTGLQDGGNTGIIGTDSFPKNEPLLLSRNDSLLAKSHNKSSRKPDPSPSRMSMFKKSSTLETPQQEEVRLGRSKSVARPEKDSIPSNTEKTKTSLPRRSSLANLKPLRESAAPMPQPQTQSIQISAPIQTPAVPLRKPSIAIRKPRETLAPEPAMPQYPSSPSSPSSLRPSPTPSPSPSPKLAPSRRSSLANFKQYQENFVPENAPPLPTPVPCNLPPNPSLPLWNNEPVYAGLGLQKNIKSQVELANEAAAALAAIVGEVEETSASKPSPALMAKKVSEEPVIGSDSTPTPDIFNVFVEPTKVDPNFAAVFSPTQDSPTLGVPSPVLESLATANANSSEIKEKKTEEKEKKREEFSRKEMEPTLPNQELKQPIIDHKIESEEILHTPEQKQFSENIVVKKDITMVENFVDQEKFMNEVVATKEGIAIEEMVIDQDLLKDKNDLLKEDVIGKEEAEEEVPVEQKSSIENPENAAIDEKAVDQDSFVKKKLISEEPEEPTINEKIVFRQSKTELELELGEQITALQKAAADGRQTIVDDPVDDSVASISSISTVSLISDTIGSAHSTPKNSVRASTTISVKTNFNTFEHDTDDEDDESVMSPWRTLAIHEISPTLSAYDIIKPRTSSDSMVQVSTQVTMPERKSQECQTQTDPAEELSHKDEENISKEDAEEVEDISPADADTDDNRPSVRSTVKVPINLQRSSSLGTFHPSQRQRSSSPLKPATPSSELFKNESNASKEESVPPESLNENQQMPKLKHRQSDGSMVSESLKMALEEQRQSQVIIQVQQRQIHDLQLQLSLSQQALRSHPTSPAHVYNGLVLSVPPKLSGTFNPSSSPSNMTRSSSRSSSISQRSSKGSSGRNSSLERAFRASRGYN